MKRAIIFSLGAVMLSGLVAVVARGASGSATGAANGASVTFSFSTPSDFPPSSPGDFQIAVFTPNKVTLSWSASVPAVQGRAIDHYDVLRNGAKIGQTHGSQFTVDYSPAGTVLEFFSLRAVDSKGIASITSAEILAPRTAALEVGGIEIESKTVHAKREIVGIQGFLSNKRYRKGTYTYHLDRTVPDFHYSTTIAREDRNFVATFDPDTNRWVSLSVSGSFYYELIDHLGPFSKIVRGTWTLVEGDPPIAELRAADGTLVQRTDENFTINTWDPTFFGGEDSAVSDTYREFYGGPDAIATERLEDEITPDDFRAGVEADYAVGVALLPTVGWNSRIDVSFGDTEIRAEGIGNFSELASRSYGERTGSLYRLHVPGTGTKTIRWAEVTFYDDGSDSTGTVRQETINLDQAGGYSQVYAVSPPAASGSTDIHILSVDVSIVTPAVSATPSNSQRLFLTNAVFAGEAGAIAIATGIGWFTGDGTNSTIVTFDEAAGVIKLVAINPAVEAEEGIDVAIGAGYEIASGADLLADPNLPGFPNLGGWKLVAIGLKAGTATIQVSLTNPSEPSPTVQTVTLTVFPQFDLAVDASRDGAISFDSSDATSVSAPYRFWLNDDNDSGDAKNGDTDDLPLAAGTSGRNADDNQVNGIRDLVDFFPVYLDVKQLLTVLPPGTNGVSYYLKQEDAALGFVFTSYTRTQAFEYLRGTPSGLDTGFGPTLTQKAGEATVTKITAAGTDLFTASPAFQARTQNNDGGVILVEASKATSKPLVLEVRKGTDVIATVQLALKTDPVETMFRYYNIRSQAHGTAIATDNQGPNYGASTPSAAPNDPFQDAPNRKHAVFVHGYNVNSREAQGSAAEMFKRLYWGGSKAKFYAVLWRGDDGQGEGAAPAGATPDYHRNVGHAWQQGPYLRDLLTSLTADTAVIAHSLGNMVTQVALTYERDPANAARLRPAARPATVKNYFAIDAALPLEALDVAAITTSSKALMRHPDWADFDERLWPTDWHSRFPSTDARSKLTWSNVFGGLDVGANFYSSGEDALANPVDGDIPVLDTLFYSGTHAWVAQEKLKGGAARFSHPVEGLAIQFLRSRNGGWVTNTNWYLPIVPTPTSGPTTRQRFPEEAQDLAAPSGVPTSGLASEPFFQRFQASESGGFYPGYQGSRLHAAIGDANADDEARKLVTVAKCLGEAIPALSFPQGSNASAAFTRPGMSGNFDLNTSAFKNGWPSSRSNTNWKHSDCLNVAFTFNFPLYDKMTNDGGLK